MGQFFCEEENIVCGVANMLMGMCRCDEKVFLFLTQAASPSVPRFHSGPRPEIFNQCVSDFSRHQDVLGGMLKCRFPGQSPRDSDLADGYESTTLINTPGDADRWCLDHSQISMKQMSEGPPAHVASQKQFLSQGHPGNKTSFVAKVTRWAKIKLSFRGKPSQSLLDKSTEHTVDRVWTRAQGEEERVSEEILWGPATSGNPTSELQKREVYAQRIILSQPLLSVLDLAPGRLFLPLGEVSIQQENPKWRCYAGKGH